MRFWLLPPVSSLSLATTADSAQWLLFIVACVVVAWITDLAYRSGRLAEDTARAAADTAREARAHREAEERFHALFEDAAVGMVVLDGDARIVTANLPFCRMLGYSCGELTGKSIYDITAPEDAERSRELNRKGHAGELLTSQFEKRYVRRDGSTLWVETGYEVAQALRAEDPGALRLVAVSGYAQADDVEKATAAGFDAHIAKPADPQEIERLLG